MLHATFSSTYGISNANNTLQRHNSLLCPRSLSSRPFTSCKTSTRKLATLSRSRWGLSHKPSANSGLLIRRGLTFESSVAISQPRITVPCQVLYRQASNLRFLELQTSGAGQFHSGLHRRMSSNSTRSSVRDEGKDIKNDSASIKSSNVNESSMNNIATKGSPSSAVNKHLVNRLPNIGYIHRPSKEELLAAATGFWSRLKVRFKWFSIRSVRPFNVDDIGAFFSWVLVGHVLWIILGTTTFFSLAILAVNTVLAQGMFEVCPSLPHEVTPGRDSSRVGWQLPHQIVRHKGCFRIRNRSPVG